MSSSSVTETERFLPHRLFEFSDAIFLHTNAADRHTNTATHFVAKVQVIINSSALPSTCWNLTSVAVTFGPISLIKYVFSSFTLFEMESRGLFQRDRLKTLPLLLL